MKVISLIGARPQFIKEAVLHQELKKAGIEEVIVNSDQHYDANMSDVFFDELEIKKPDFNMGIGSGSHGEMTGKIMIEFEKIVMEEKPEMIIVYGDTNTTLAGAIVGAKLKIPITHIEAGVRMIPKDMPEEINRELTDRISSLLFCSSQRYVENLKLENIREGVHFVGDIMYDLFLKLETKFRYDEFKKYNLKEEGFVLLTLHRDFNVDDKVRFEKILKQIQQLSSQIKIVFPIHPRTRKKLTEFGFEYYLNDVEKTDPLDYLNLMGLVKKSKYVITDSGGLQKESYFANKKAFLFMDDPAWHELVEKGINILVDDDLLDKVHGNFKVDFEKYIYGSGNAGEKIVNIITKYLG